MVNEPFLTSTQKALKRVFVGFRMRWSLSRWGRGEIVAVQTVAHGGTTSAMDGWRPTMRPKGLVSALALVVAAEGGAVGEAHAQPSTDAMASHDVGAGSPPLEPRVPSPPSTASVMAPERPPPPPPGAVRWSPSWRKFALGEYLTTGALLLGTGAIILFGEEGEPNWRTPILFDETVRDGLRASTDAGRRRAQSISDGFYYGELAYPFVVDVVAVTWLAHGAPEVAGQMALMDSEAFAITGFLSFVSNAAIRRERPYVQECAPSKPDPVFPACDSPGQAESFFSGHTAIAFTGATLSCMHHANLPLYGESGVGGAVACFSLVAGATTGGMLRIVADKHHATDVVVGSAIGIASGVLVPWFHYRDEAPPSGERSGASASLRWLPAPMLSSSGAGVGAIGVF